jgi:hypothetical protein
MVIRQAAADRPVMVAKNKAWKQVPRATMWSYEPRPEQPSQPQINSWAMSDRVAGVMDLAGIVGDVALSHGIAFAYIS